MVASVGHFSPLFVLAVACLALTAAPGPAAAQEGTLSPFQQRNYGGPPYAFAYGASYIWDFVPQFFGGYNARADSSTPLQGGVRTLDFGFNWGAVVTPLPGPCAAGGSTQVTNQLLVFCGTGAGGALSNTVYISTDPLLTAAWGSDSVKWPPRSYFSVERFVTPADPYGTVVIAGGYTGYGVGNEVVSNEVAILSTNQYYTTTQAPWGPRYGHTTVMDAAQTTMILTGGIGYFNQIGPTYMNDVWSLNVYTVGTNFPGLFWNRLTASAPFAGRFAASMWNMNDFFYVAAGGASSTGSLSDVWVSPDYGQSWQLVTNSASFSPRQGASVVVIGRQVLLYGGTASMAATPYQDVWVAFQ